MVEYRDASGTTRTVTTSATGDYNVTVLAGAVAVLGEQALQPGPGGCATAIGRGHHGRGIVALQAARMQHAVHQRQPLRADQGGQQQGVDPAGASRAHGVECSACAAALACRHGKRYINDSCLRLPFLGCSLKRL